MDEAMKLIDLSDVLLSAEAVVRWQKAAERIAPVALKLGISPEKIPDEQAGILRNGNLKIFVPLSGGVEVSMEVPAKQWSMRMPKN